MIAFPKSQPTRDAAYMERVRLLPCLLRYSGGCYGATEAHHAGDDKGMSMKASDLSTVPLCTAHHRNWHDHGGYFAGMVREDRRTWAAVAIRQVRLVMEECVDPAEVPW